MLFVLGIVVFALGIGFTVAWHELGHYATARWFGIRVPEFMVGWGPTVFSRRAGETEFGLKAIPIGGFVRMVGMLPPRAGEWHGRSRKSGPFQGLIESARDESELIWQPGDERREFWTRAPWKRIVVMAAGPVMNLILAVLLLAVSLMAIGTPGTLTVADVSQCMVTTRLGSAPADGQCPPGAPPTPAAAAGLRAGDTVLSMAGVPYDKWETFRRAVRTTTGTVPLVVLRDGQQVTLRITPLVTNLPRLDKPSEIVRGAFLGFDTTQDYQRQGIGFAIGRIGQYVAQTGDSLVRLPGRVPDLFRQALLGAPRDANTPLSVVGVSRLGGQVLGTDTPWKARLSFLLGLLAGVNLSMFLINLLPVPPFDGGHIMAAAWESVRRRLATLRGRADPGPVDLARLLPVAYVVGLLFIGYSALVVLADVVNPLQPGS
ncbi:MAG TPA: site-2 protease family protein [Pseudonocardia sp.]|jgi:membrane-associated protease RseP (regulator of RpoE activity)